MNEQDLYLIYTRTFGKVASGTKLANADFGTEPNNADFDVANVLAKFTPYGEEGHAAVSMAAQDVKSGGKMREKSEVISQIKRLLGTTT